MADLGGGIISGLLGMVQGTSSGLSKSITDENEMKQKADLVNLQRDADNKRDEAKAIFANKLNEDSVIKAEGRARDSRASDSAATRQLLAAQDSAVNAEFDKLKDTDSLSEEDQYMAKSGIADKLGATEMASKYRDRMKDLREGRKVDIADRKVDVADRKADQDSKALYGRANPAPAIVQTIDYFIKGGVFPDTASGRKNAYDMLNTSKGKSVEDKRDDLRGKMAATGYHSEEEINKAVELAFPDRGAKSSMPSKDKTAILASDYFKK